MIFQGVLLFTALTSAKAQLEGQLGPEIQNSDRVGANACPLQKEGTPVPLGAECTYSCKNGYISVGRHVLQLYETQDRVVVNNEYFGGNCYPLCDGSQQCSSGRVPLRWNDTGSNGWCMETLCFTEDDALKTIARGHYEVWRMVRNPRTGMYIGSIDPNNPSSIQWSNGDLQSTGLGLQMESIAHALGFITLGELQERILQTLHALTGKVNGFSISRKYGGWLPREFDSNTGLSNEEGASIFHGGSHFSGLLFARTYSLNIDPSSSQTAEIVRLTDQHVKSVNWTHLLCKQQPGKTHHVSDEGTGIPGLIKPNGACLDVLYPQADGYYDFTEDMPVVWLIYSKACGAATQGKCPHTAIQNMWDSWQGRRLHPNRNYVGRQLLSSRAAYVTQLPQYLTYSFNSDTQYQLLFNNAWKADRDLYKSPVYYQGKHIYGLGSGSTSRWCAGSGESVGKYTLSPEKGKCRMWSPASIAGYLPTAPAPITEHLLQVLADGVAVTRLPRDIGNGNLFYLSRKSLLQPSFAYSATMVDLAGCLWGLSTRWLGLEFYTQNSDFTKPPPTPLPTASPTASPTLSPTSSPTPSPTITPSSVASQASQPVPGYSNPQANGVVSRPRASPTLGMSQNPAQSPTALPTTGLAPTSVASPTVGMTNSPTPLPTVLTSYTTANPTLGMTSSNTPSPTRISDGSRSSKSIASPVIGITLLPTPGPTPGVSSPTPVPTRVPTVASMPNPTTNSSYNVTTLEEVRSTQRTLLLVGLGVGGGLLCCCCLFFCVMCAGSFESSDDFYKDFNRRTRGVEVSGTSESSDGESSQGSLLQSPGKTFTA